MTETKPIPGPWEVRALNQYRKSFQVSVAAESYPHPDTAAATALLIAAAPELLEALRFVLAHAFEAKWAGDERALDLVEAAIAKATGGSP